MINLSTVLDAERWLGLSVAECLAEIATPLLDAAVDTLMEQARVAGVPGVTEWADEIRAALLTIVGPRFRRAVEIVIAEAESIPRRDADLGDIIGVIHGHAVHVPVTGRPRCDCPDWSHRLEQHGGYCKHYWATLIVEALDDLDARAWTVLESTENLRAA